MIWGVWGVWGILNCLLGVVILLAVVFKPEPEVKVEIPSSEQSLKDSKCELHQQPIGKKQEFYIICKDIK